MAVMDPHGMEKATLDLDVDVDVDFYAVLIL